MSCRKVLLALGLLLMAVLVGMTLSACGSGTSTYTPPPATEVGPGQTALPPTAGPSAETPAAVTSVPQEGATAVTTAEPPAATATPGQYPAPATPAGTPAPSPYPTP